MPLEVLLEERPHLESFFMSLRAALPPPPQTPPFPLTLPVPQPPELNSNSRLQ